MSALSSVVIVLVPCHLGWRGPQNLRAGFESRKGPPIQVAATRYTTRRRAGGAPYGFAL